MNAVAVKRGRPQVYRDSFPGIARTICSQGGTLPVLADTFRVSLTAVEKWMNTRKDFGDAIREGRGIAAERLQEAIAAVSQPVPSVESPEAAPAVVEAAVSDSEPVSSAPPVVTQQEAPQTAPEASAETRDSIDDFRALLGLPPRED